MNGAGQDFAYFCGSSSLYPCPPDHLSCGFSFSKREAASHHRRTHFMTFSFKPREEISFMNFEIFFFVAADGCGVRGDVTDTSGWTRISFSPPLLLSKAVLRPPTPTPAPSFPLSAFSHISSTSSYSYSPTFLTGLSRPHKVSR